MIEQSSKFDIGVNSKVFVAEKTKTTVSKANEITDTEYLTSRLMSLDRHYLDLSEKECTYVVSYLYHLGNVAYIRRVIKLLW